MVAGISDLLIGANTSEDQLFPSLRYKLNSKYSFIKYKLRFLIQLLP